ncbi:MAG: glycoside hydrolase family 78 protein [Oscillospiraceae bacterium]|jgi:alpha-L-rhamnosidase|nr:glycoside hydrolase family 78 protein [Oscillospiraceae bacterium]
MRITSCKTNHLTNPLGFQTNEASVTWIVEDTPSQRQKSARVQVAADPAMQDILWDSGADARLDSRAVTLPITMAPRTRYYWTAAVEGDAGDSAVSDVNWFETAKIDEPWAAQWITPPWTDLSIHPYVRKEFGAAGVVKRARAYITGLGLYELYINGRRVGDETLTPNCNSYDSWVQYQTFDITDALQAGVNACGVMLGNGWAKGRFGTFGKNNTPYTNNFSLICEIHIEYENGLSDIIRTDESWRCHRSPVVDSGIYDGEVYDARLEIKGWSEPGLDDGQWEAARLFDPSGLGKLTDRLSPPVKVMREIKPVAVITTPAGETVLDMGQNMVGWLRFRINEPRGTRVTISHGEILQHGLFYRDNLRGAKAQFDYIADGAERWVEPRFTFYGFRYAKLEGFTGAVSTDDFVGCVVYSALDTIGGIETSDPNVNQLFQNALWSQMDNFLDVPTDCPQRDERMGWTGDTEVFSGTALFNMDAYPFYVKFMHDLWLEQAQCEGLVASTIPTFRRDKPTEGGFMQGGACSWSDCATVVPWEAYLHTGDQAILARQYPSMKAWVDWVTRTCQKDGTGLLWSKGFQFGDWLALDGPVEGGVFGGTDNGYLASAYYRLSSLLVSKTAAVLGFDEDAKQYGALSESIRKAIVDEYFTPTGRLALNNQTAYVIALHFQIADDWMRPRVLADLLDRLAKDNMHLKTGFIGTPYLCRALTDNGCPGAAYRLFFNTDYPSWLYEVLMGATTIWERWNSVLPNGLLSGTDMNSLNHYAYGSIVEWMYRNMCGINPVEEAPGFKKIRLAPQPNGELTFARASVRTAMGIVRCGWRFTDNSALVVEAEAPFDAEAELYLPHARLEDIDGLDGLSAEQAGESVRVTLAAGRYSFTYMPSKTFETYQPDKRPWH